MEADYESGYQAATCVIRSARKFKKQAEAATGRNRRRYPDVYRFHMITMDMDYGDLDVGHRMFYPEDR